MHGLPAFALAAILLLPTLGHAQDSTLSTFESNPPGYPPSTGGQDEPSWINWTNCDGSCLVEVQQSPFGMDSRAAVIGVSEADAGNPGLTWQMDGRPSIAALEFTVSFEHTNFSTSVLHLNGTLRSVRIAHVNGKLNLAVISQGPSGHVPLGEVGPGSPARIRLEFCAWGGTVVGMLDDEMNGFRDDPAVVNPYFNGLVRDLTLYLLAPLVQASMAVDDVLVEYGEVLFCDGFESGGTARWDPN